MTKANDNHDRVPCPECGGMCNFIPQEASDIFVKDKWGKSFVKDKYISTAAVDAVREIYDMIFPLPMDKEKGYEKLIEIQKTMQSRFLAEWIFKNKRANVTCDCGSHNTYFTGVGGSQEADASRNLPAMEGDEVCCADCGKTFWY